METTQPPDLPARRAALWLILIVVVAACLRFYRLGVEPLWHDEVFELIQVEDFWGTLLTGANVSSHPPLYVVLMKAASVLGVHGSEFGIRIVAALLGIATIPAVYLTASHLFTRRIGLVAAAIVAVSAFHIVHSQDAKSYILLPLTGTLLLYLSLRAWEAGGRWWPIYSLMAALAFYSQAFAVPLLVLLNGWYLVTAIRHKRPLVPWFVANVAAFLLVLPWILIMLGKASTILIAAEDWWVPRPGLRELGFAIKTMAFGYSDQSPAFWMVLLACVVLAATGAWALLRSQPRNALLTMLWFAFPVLALLLISQVTNSIFLFRALLPFAIPLYILVGAGVLAIPRVPWRIGAATLLFAATLPSLSDHYFREYGPHEFPHRPGIHLPIDYDEAAAFILEGWREGDRILLASNASMLPLYGYGIRDESMRMRTVSANADHIDYILRSNPPLLVSNPIFRDYYPTLVPEAIGDARRIWFVFSDWEQEYLRFSALDTWRWLDARYTETDHQAWRGIELFLYAVAEAPAVIQRDHDDGVEAMHSLRPADGMVVEHPKVLADAGVVREPLNARRGSLALAWEGEDAFAVRNETGQEAVVDIHIVHSAALIPIASWIDAELAEGWRVSAWHHTEPPPQEYSITTATCALQPGEVRTLSGSIPAGAIIGGAPMLCWYGPAEDPATRRAALSVTIGGVSADVEWQAAAPGWHWSPLRVANDPSPDGDSIPVEIVVEGVHAGASYANLAYVALGGAGSRATQLEAVHLEARGARSFPIDGPTPRTDVWVFERGEGGKVYHIFRERPR